MGIIARIILHLISRIAARSTRRRQGTAEFHRHGDDQRRRSGPPPLAYAWAAGQPHAAHPVLGLPLVNLRAKAEIACGPG